jgi:DNA ligase-1
MKPMLLYQQNPDLKKIEYPVYVTAKLDGIRCITHKGAALSRSLKPIPNEFIQSVLAKLPHGLDGELIVGEPTAKDVFQQTTSFVRSIDKVGPFNFYVFDFWDSNEPYINRQTIMRAEAKKDKQGCIVIVEPLIAHNEADIIRTEAFYVDQGYEGVILRNPHGEYKHGRTTATSNNAYKLKRFADSEAIVTDILPEMHNANEVKRGATGKIERSTTAAGLVAKKSMGALVVHDEKLNWTFQVGTGFTAEQRKWWWESRAWILASKSKMVIKYKYFPVGVVDKPRHPVFLGVREKFDT